MQQQARTMSRNYDLPGQAPRELGETDLSLLRAWKGVASGSVEDAALREHVLSVWADIKKSAHVCKCRRAALLAGLTLSLAHASVSLQTAACKVYLSCCRARRSTRTAPSSSSCVRKMTALFWRWAARSDKTCGQSFSPVCLRRKLWCVADRLPHSPLTNQPGRGRHGLVLERWTASLWRRRGAGETGWRAYIIQRLGVAC